MKNYLKILGLSILLFFFSIPSYCWDRDLVITSVIQNADLIIGRRYTVEMEIRNNTIFTNVYNNFNVSVYFNYLGGPLIQQFRVDVGLAWIYPFKTKTVVNTTITLPSSLITEGESYALIYQVDSQNENVESNENNNLYVTRGKATSSPASLPDLVPQSITLTGTPFYPSGQMFNCSYVVANNTNTIVNGFNVKFYLSDRQSLTGTLIDNRYCFGMIGIKQNTYNFNPSFDESLKTWAKYLVMVVDPDNKITESNNDNNAFYYALPGAPPSGKTDFSVEAYDIPSTVYKNDYPSYDLKVSIKNSGNITGTPNKIYFTWVIDMEGVDMSSYFGIGEGDYSWKVDLEPTESIAAGETKIITFVNSGLKNVTGVYWAKAGVTNGSGVWSFKAVKQTILPGYSSKRKSAQQNSFIIIGDSIYDEVSVSPNPVKNYFVISNIPDEYIGGQIKVLSSAGVIIYNQGITSYKTEVNNFNAMSGNYIIKLIPNTGSKIITKKLIVTK